MDEVVLAQIEELENQIRICKQILTNTDYQAIKYAEGLLTDDEFADVKALREEMRANVNSYEAQIEVLSE
ncbi:MAG: hypothetical protein LIO71_02950 [Ruminococcus sp.]|nr:hypothetical protein [Ruminococcus sp.]